MITTILLSLALALMPPMQQAHIATTATRVPIAAPSIDDSSMLSRAWQYHGLPDTMYRGLYFKGDSLKSMFDATQHDGWFKTDTIRMREE